MNIHLQAPKPLRLTLPDGRVYVVPAPTRDQIARCDALAAAAGAALGALETGRAAALTILCERSARHREDGTFDESERLPVGELGAWSEVEILHAIAALHFGANAEAVVALQRVLLQRDTLRAVAAEQRVEGAGE